MKLFAIALGLLLLVSCADTPRAPQAAPAAALEFIDLQRFDQQLAASLGAPLPRVEVSFHDRIAPSKLPPRLQQWMAAVENGGGKVRVVQPPGSVTARSPLLLISAISALWQGQKVAGEAAAAMALRTAHGYDADLLLEQSPAGEVHLGRVVFLRRPR